MKSPLIKWLSIARLSFLLLLFSTFAVEAQVSEFVFPTTEQSNSNFGSILRIDENGTQDQILSFDSTLARNFDDRVPITSYNGRYYIMSEPYAGNGGSILEYDDSTQSFNTFMNFAGNPVSFFKYSTISDSGILYGATNLMLFKVNMKTKSFEKLHDFTSATGATVRSAPILASNNKLYGVTMYGGDSNAGVFYEYDLQQDTYQVKLHFQDSILGRLGEFSPIEASNGKIYGTVGYNYYVSNHGGVFVYDPNLDSITLIKNFAGTALSKPEGRLIEMNDGKLYSTTLFDFVPPTGWIFSFDLTTDSINQEYKYENKTSSYFTPHKGLVRVEDDKLYGLFIVQPNNRFQIYSYGIGDTTHEILYDFDKTNHNSIYGAPIYDSSKKCLFGIGESLNNNGFVYKFNTQTDSMESIVYNYTSFLGRGAFSGLVKQLNGKYYGLTRAGGRMDAGVLYSYDEYNNKYYQEIQFDGQSGGYPGRDLRILDDTTILSVTRYGGNYGYGTLYHFNTKTGKKMNLHHFDSDDNGFYPLYTPIKADDGLYYGINSEGLNNDSGTIYAYDMVLDTLWVVHAFDHPSDQGLFSASNGVLYGTVVDDGNGKSQVFSFDIYSEAFTIEATLTQAQGYHPSGEFIQTNSTSIIGVTREGGNNGFGTIYSYDFSTENITILHHFNGSNGADPSYVIQAANGKLYGNTKLGGTHDLGVFFEYDLSTNTYQVLTHFDSTNGGYAYAKPLEELICVPVSSQLDLSSCDPLVSPSQRYTYTSSGVYFDTLQTGLGCDSVIRIDLDLTTINNQISQTADTLSSADTTADYQWFRCDNGYTEIQGEENRKLTVEKDGEYAVVLSKNGCLDTSECIVVKVTSIKKHTITEPTIYPNPVYDVLSISLPKGAPSNFTIKVLDVKGRVMLEEDQCPAQIEAYTWSEGLYFIHLIDTEQGSVYTYRIVKL